ncbi:MAG: replication initiation factor domain-containing protein [Magnetococcales bacterium]|nr:replication initiation factor domain-containing protein [Magnetococcales bacterium]
MQLLDIHIDWLSFTFPKPLKYHQMTMIKHFVITVLGFTYLQPTKKGTKAKHYLYEGDILNKHNNKVGFFGFGGNNNTILIVLTGRAFNSLYTRRSIDPLKTIKRLRNNIRKLGGRITRVDLAMDDLQGHYNIKYAKTAYKEGHFSRRGPSPKNLTYTNSDGGSTLRVGTVESGKTMTIYRKGIKEKAINKKWMRWELRLSRKGKEINLNVLVNPGLAFKNSYPVTQEMNISTNDTDIETRIEQVKKNEEIDLQSMLTHCRNSYGKLIHYLVKKKIPSELIIASLIGEKGPPARLKKWIGDHDLKKSEIIEILHESIEEH